jgi:hypothetical protein
VGTVDQPSLEIRVLVESEEEARVLRDAATEAGGTADVTEAADADRRDIAPIVVLLWVAVAGAAGVVAEHLLDRKGRIIDLTKTPVTIEKADLPRGTLLVILPDGKYEIKEASKSSLENILSAAGVAAAKAAVETAGGVKKE